MQPTYLPWIGYFALIDLVDVFVFLDDVQLVKQSWQTRNRIKRQDGEDLILSVPISRALGIHERMIKDVEINDGTPWVNKHLRSFEQYYRKAPHFAEAMALYEPGLPGTSLTSTLASRSGNLAFASCPAFSLLFT